MALRFRTATPDDVAAVVEVVHAAYRGAPTASTWTTEAHLLGGQRVDADMVTTTLGDVGRRVIVGISGTDGTDSVVSCCEVSAPDRRGRSELGMFAVDPQRQSGGIGRQTLAEGERQASAWGAAAVELHVIDLRHELIEWYRRRGYAPTGESIPFPYGDERYGLPRRDDLCFAVLVKALTNEPFTSP